MIEYVRGNLLEADAEALVNTVNTVGVMGKGIALQFRQAYPQNYEAYRRASLHKEVQPGRMFVFRTGQLTNPRLIINFPTKRHWRGKALLEDIRTGLGDLVSVVKRERIESIALPPLGCGNGGLRWSEVKPMMENAFHSIPTVRVLAFEPMGAPAAEKMKIATTRPRMTAARAALLGLLGNYAVPGYRTTLLEIQKLAYFLQAAGEPLRLRFEHAPYGPYAENLHHVLQRIEGHFIRGYGDRSRGATIQALPSSSEESQEVLRQYPDTLGRLRRVADLIEGFETPYGMELLATVHWLARENPNVSKDSAEAIDGVRAWSERKRTTFQAEHVQIAWSRLRDQSWI